LPANGSFTLRADLPHYATVSAEYRIYFYQKQLPFIAVSFAAVVQETALVRAIFLVNAAFHATATFSTGYFWHS